MIRGKLFRVSISAAVLILLFALACPAKAAEAVIPLYRSYIETDDRLDAPEGIVIQLSGPDEILVGEGESVTLTADVQQAGYYHLAYRYRVPGTGLVTPEGSWTLNGIRPFAELSRVVFPALWSSREEEFLRDRYGTQLVPMQVKKDVWQKGYVSDSGGLEPEPLRFYCEPGLNTFTLEMYTASVSLKDICLTAPALPPSYDVYRENNQGSESAGFQFIMEAEKPAYKNTTMVIPAHDRGYDAVPYETYTRPLNMIDETTWFLAGDMLCYTFEVPYDGYYQFSFKYKQTDKPNVKVFRSITIDGETPFIEMRGYGFNYSENWKLETLNRNGEAYGFYLTAGVHTLGVAVEAGPYRDIIYSLKDIDAQIGAMYTELKKITGSQTDTVRDWHIDEYFPDMAADLAEIRNVLIAQSDRLAELNDGRRNSDQQSYITLAIKVVEGLLKKPNDIPKKTALFTEGSGSVSQLVAKGISDINMQAMSLDRIYIHSADRAPEFKQTPFIKSTAEWFKRFIATFRAPKDNLVVAADKTIDVWVNRSRNHVDVLQRLTDSLYTPASGVSVRYSLLADDHKLTLAAASGIAPDAAIGVPAQIPYEMGIRGAAYNLRQFDDFGREVGQFPPGAFLALVADDSVYGLPETLDFHVTFYRKDILEALGIPVPGTWEEVAEIMPELQRYGMNYYTGLATGAGYKDFKTTAPFILQNGGSIYSQDGMSAAIDSEASLRGIKLMCDLSTIYGLSLQVNSFFESFRSGVTPLGVSGFASYMEMLIAAPELMDSWSIAPAPGVEDENGIVQRQYPGLATADMIFTASTYKDEAWDLLKWWMSEEVQSEYAIRMKTIYGTEYLYNSANLAAFANLPIRSQDKKVILEQWQSLTEVQNVPGWYLVEREISNVWNAVVFENGKLYDRVDLASVLSNREIMRRMREFGFAGSNGVLKPYPLYTVEDIEAWKEGGS